MLDDYIRRWGLVPDAAPILTATSYLLPVSYQGQPAMLKLARCEEERRGNAVMAWWNGDGAARVLARCDDAIVMERANSGSALVDLSRTGRDDDAVRGDLHHGNILHFGERGWLAIDPKGLLGDRVFDYANLLCNPSHRIAVDRFSQRVAILVDAAGIDRRRLLQWTLAWSGLSALWMIEDGLSPETRLCIAALAATELKLL